MISTVQVLKRDGDAKQDFSLDKIEKAISCAFKEVGKEIDNDFLSEITNLVSLKIKLRSSSSSMVEVETIQDLVETTLMETGFTDVAKAYILYRNKKERIRRKRLATDHKAISDYIHPSKYARYLPGLKRREVYSETVDRVQKMHTDRFPAFEEEIKEIHDAVKDKRILPSMRAMQFSGPAIEKNNARIYNCSFCHVDKVRAFGDILYLLLCGCGVGYSVQHEHVEKLPSLSHIDNKKVRHFTIADSIEGWANSLTQLINSYVKCYYVEFNYSKIRNEGELLKTSGGKAPGHLSLKKSLEAIRGILSGAQGRQLRPIECYDIICIGADAVLSGGIRRSATLSLFSLEDNEMMSAKTGNWWSTHPWRANANNSVALKRGEITKRQFKCIFKYTQEYGEPGFVFVDDYNHGVNPCQISSSTVLTPDGIRTFADISEGSTIWTQGKWTKVTNKWCTGVKPVYEYETRAGVFIGTENHRILQRGEKVEVDLAETIDTCQGPQPTLLPLLPNDIMSGLLIGDGSNNTGGRSSKVGLIVGEDDQDYFNSEIKNLFISKGNDKFWYVNTDFKRLGHVAGRKVPDEYFYGDSTKVRGFLRGLYSANGSVVSNRVTLKSSSFELVKQTQQLLSFLGIKSYYTTNKSKNIKFPNGTYKCKESYDLNITTDRDKFLDRIGFIQIYKQEKLLNILDKTNKSKYACSRPKLTYEIVSKKYLGDLEVFDITVDCEEHTYWTGGLLVSNCGEISLNPVLKIDEDVLEIIERKRQEGQFIPKVKIGDEFTGVQMCNLTEINAAKFKNSEDMFEAARLASKLGTLQASYTSFPYLGWVTEVIVEREALLGVSMTGMLDNPEISLNEENQRTAAKIVVEENERFSKVLGIRPASRLTCVKPSGTASLMLNCIGSGIHAHHARRYIRRVTANELETVFNYFKSKNPHMCVKKPNGDWVIEFPISAPDVAIVQSDLTAIEFLDIVKNTQNNWVTFGTSKNNRSPGTCHNVSNTIVVKSDEWAEVMEYLWTNQRYFSGVSLLPATGDKDYSFSPREAIQTEADEDHWNQLLKHYVPVDYTNMVEYDDGTNLTGELSCAGGSCEI